MPRIAIITLHKVISPIIASQIKSIKQVERVNLDPKDLVSKETDSDMVREIKEQALKRLTENNVAIASHAIDLVDAAIEIENVYLANGRKLRKQAEEIFVKARKLHNARTHLLETGEALPIALELNLVNSEDIGVVTEYVKTLNVPDYFGGRKKVEADKTA